MFIEQLEITKKSAQSEFLTGKINSEPFTRNSFSQSDVSYFEKLNIIIIPGFCTGMLH